MFVVFEPTNLFVYYRCYITLATTIRQLKLTKMRIK